MSKQVMKLRAEYSQGRWAFVDPDNDKVRIGFDQAIMDATHIARGQVTGYVKAVHGVDMEDVQFMNNQQKEALGITGNHRLGAATLKRVRLLESGRIEPAVRLLECGSIERVAS